MADLSSQLGIIDLQSARNRGKMLGLDQVTVQQHRVRSLVVDDYPAVAIEYSSTRCQDGNTLDAVSFGRFTVDAGILHLQSPESRNQKDKNGDSEVLEDRNLPGDFLRFIAQQPLRTYFLVPFALAL